MSAMICFENVGKRYGDHRVLSGLNFEISKGDVVGILGPSGVGKSTMLKMVAGLENTSSGCLRVNADKISFVFQEPRLFPWKTALQNVMLPLRAAGVDKQNSIKTAMQFLEAMELTEFADYYPSQLSGGMMQRVSLARAFAAQPDILLLDEPFSALDNKLRNQLLDMIAQQLQQRPVTVLYVSHSPNEVKRIASRVFLLNSGNDMQEGKISSL